MYFHIHAVTYFLVFLLVSISPHVHYYGDMASFEAVLGRL
jgi:hypothetical protein